jgi:hypothetical protein
MIPGIGQRTTNDVLIEASLQMAQPVVWTSITAPVVAGTHSVTVGSTSNMYIGAQVVIGFGTANVEAVTISNVGAGAFAATFANSHASGEAVTGSTFASQAATDPIFTTNELLRYLSCAQNEFLSKVACIFGVFNQTIAINELYQATPPTAIEINHISCQGVRLYELTQTELTMRDRNWKVETLLTPTAFFEDRTGLYKWGVNGIPRSNFPCEILASIRDSDSLTLLDGFAIPDILVHFLKYKVMQDCYSKDGVLSDPQRAAYCGERFDRGVVATQRWLDATGATKGMRRS